jgi:hypothetical protein
MKSSLATAVTYLLTETQIAATLQTRGNYLHTNKNYSNSKDKYNLWNPLIYANYVLHITWAIQ